MVQITFSKDKLDLLQILAPIEEKILLCRCSAQKIATDSGKKLLKNKTIYNSLSTKYKQSISTTPDKQRNTAQPAPQRSFKKNNSNNLIQKIKQKTPIQPKITTRATVIPKTRSKPQKPQPKTPSPYDPQNPYKEPQSSPKDITVKDIEKDLIENDPLKGSQTDMDTKKSNEAQNDSFETIAPEEDNPVRKEFEIGQLESDELQEDEITRNEPGQNTTGNAKASKRNFNILKILHQ